MTEFEVLSVLISIVIGFGLTHILSGLGRAFHFRRTNKMDAIHIGWTIAVFLILVLNWWVSLLWLDFEDWTFTVFFTIILWTTSMYVMAIALYPPHQSGDVSYREIYETNRTWFLSSFVVMCLLDLTVTYLRDQTSPDLVYTAYIGHFIVLTAIGVWVSNRSYNLIIAWYIAIALALWSFGVRGTLNL